MAEVAQGVLLSQVVPAGTYRIDQVKHHGIFFQRDPAHIVAHGIHDVIHQYHEFRGDQRTVIHPAAAVVDQAGPNGSGTENLQGGFGAGLGVTKFGVRGSRRTEKGQPVVLGHLGQGTCH